MDNNELKKVKWLAIGGIVLNVILTFVIIAWMTAILW